MQEYQEKLQQVAVLLRSGKAFEAFKAFRPLLSYPGQLQQAHELSEALSIFADIGNSIVGEEFAGIMRNAAQHPESDEALYHAGYALFEQELYDLAATVLAHAHRLYPASDAILNELSVALEHGGRYTESCNYLQAAHDLVQSNFICCYMLAFNALMSGDLELPRSLLSDLRRLQVQDERFESMTARIAHMLQRADALAGHTALDLRDLRGWHMIISAGLLLHLSPYGFDEGMRGRYAFVQDSNARCLEGVRRVQAVLEELQVVIPRVFALPDRDSKILAHACASLFNCPLENWPADGSEAPGLIVAYDLSLCASEVLSSLIQHRPGQILWSHAACWIKDQPVAPDLCTFLYQVNHASWGERMVVKPGTHNIDHQPPDERDPAVLGAEIVAATLETGSLDDLPALVSLARAAATVTGEAAPGVLCTTGWREKQRMSSPVRSSRFA